MATIGKITRADSGTAAIDYAYGKNRLDQETKDWLLAQGVSSEIVSNLKDRAVAMSGLNVLPEYASQQMKYVRDSFGTKGKEVTRIIQSFSDSDLSASNPKDWEKANELGFELARKLFPNYQVAVYTQLDGEGHKLHNHLILNMPDIDTGEKYHVQNSWMKIAEMNDRIAMEHGLSVIENDLSKDLNYENKVNVSKPEKRTMSEIKQSLKGQYVWKDDLRDRIDKVILNQKVSSLDKFKEELEQKGVSVTERGDKIITYSFFDQENKQRKARGTSLGSDYEKETILNELERQDRQPESTEQSIELTVENTATIEREVRKREFNSARRKREAERLERESERRKQEIEHREQESPKLIERVRAGIARGRSIIANSKRLQQSRELIERFRDKISDSMERFNARSEVASDKQTPVETQEPHKVTAEEYMRYMRGQGLSR